MTIPQGPGGQGGAGDDRPAAEAARRGGQDGADRRHRHGGAGRVRRAGRHRAAQRAGPADRGVPPRAGRAAGPGEDRPAATSSRPRPTGCSRAGCWSGSSATWRPSRTGRHQGPVVGEGAVELQQTKPYEFGDSLANMDIPGSLINAMIRDGPGPAGADRARKTSRSTARATRPSAPRVVLLDMSGSMRYDGLYVNVKRMGLALEGLIRREYPGRLSAVHRDVHLRQAAARRRDRRADAQAGDDLRPGRAAAGRHERRADQRDATSRRTSPTSSTGCSWPGSSWPTQDTPNRQIILITDGLPTAHFEEQFLYLLYPPEPRTEEATLREGPALPARRDHDQHLPAAQLVAVERGRAVRLPPGRIDRGPRLLHRRQGPRPLRGLGLREPQTRNRGLKPTLRKARLRTFSPGLWLEPLPFATPSCLRGSHSFRFAPFASSRFTPAFVVLHRLRPPCGPSLLACGLNHSPSPLLRAFVVLTPSASRPSRLRGSLLPSWFSTA